MYNDSAAIHINMWIAMNLSTVFILKDTQIFLLLHSTMTENWKTRKSPDYEKLLLGTYRYNRSHIINKQYYMLDDHIK